MLNHSFLSVNTDFWTDTHRKECFGAIVADIIAEKYLLDDGRELFMSKKLQRGWVTRFLAMLVHLYFNFILASIYL